MFLKFQRNTVIALLCIAGFLLDLYLFYPGFMAPDTIDQYTQAVTGKYNDWHPTTMALWWSVLNKIYKGPSLMLIGQLLMLWSSCYLIATASNKRLLQTGVVLLCTLPFIQNFAGYIIKDSQMALAWLLALSMLYHYSIQGKRLSSAANLFVALLIVYGSCLRPNAFPGAIPLCILWGVQTFHQYARRIQYAAATVLFIMIFVFQGYIIPSISKPEPYYPQSKLYLHDLAGIYVRTRENVFPDILYEDPHFDTNAIKQKYHTATFDMLWWDTEGKVNLNYKAERITSDLRTAWGHALKNNFAVYIQNRWDGFLYYLRFKNRTDDFQVIFPWIQPNEFGFVQPRNPLRDRFASIITQQRNFFYMQPWFWLFVNLILLVVAGKRKQTINRIFGIALLLSSLGYLLPQIFIFQTDTDFRYFYWNCIACSIAFLVLAAPSTQIKKG